MRKDNNELYDLEDIIEELTFEYNECPNARTLKSLEYYTWMKETLDRFEYEN